MKRLLSSKPARIAMIILVLSAPVLVAFQVEDPGTEFSEAQLVILTTFFLPLAAQIVKVYREKGGKKPSAAVINWSIFAVGVIMTIFWGKAASFFGGISWPSFDPAEPYDLIGSIWTFVNSVFLAGGKVLGVAVAYYMLLKPLVFRFIPWFQTKEMKAAIAAKKKA